MSLLQLIALNINSCLVITVFPASLFWMRFGVIAGPVRNQRCINVTCCKPDSHLLQRGSRAEMCCRAKGKFCRNSELLFQTHVVEVCSKAGKRNKLPQPVHLWSRKGSFTCLHISSSKTLKEFPSSHIWPLFMRGESLLPFCLIPAGFVAKYLAFHPLQTLRRPRPLWAGTHHLLHKIHGGAT